MLYHQNLTESCFICQFSSYSNPNCNFCINERFAIEKLQNCISEVDNFQIQKSFNGRYSINNSPSNVLNYFNDFSDFNDFEKKIENWAKIDKLFAEKDLLSKKTYQQKWEELDLTYQDAENFIFLGFTPADHLKVDKWKRTNLNLLKIKWLFRVGLTSEDHIFFKFFQKDGYQFDYLNSDNLDELKIKCSWKSIHQDFDFWKREEWEKKGFNYKEVWLWIKYGLTVDDYLFAFYLKKDGYYPNQINKDNYLELEKKCSWWNVHANFNFLTRRNWENVGLVYRDAQEWISLGFSTGDYWKIKEWKNQSLTPQDSHFLFRATFNSKTQEWIDINYPLEGNYSQNKEKRSDFISLSFENKKLFGSVKLVGFFNLENFYCTENQLIELNLTDCSELLQVNCFGNRIVNLFLPSNNKVKVLNINNNNLTKLPLEINPEILTELSVSNNNFQFKDLKLFSDFINLEKLDLSSNHFTGSLELLKNLSKLKELDIGNTDINHGLEYLPWSIGEGKLSLSKGIIRNYMLFSSFKINEKMKKLISENINFKRNFKFINYNDFLLFGEIGEDVYGNVSKAIYFGWRGKCRKVTLKSIKKNFDNYEEKVLKEIADHHFLDDKKNIECIGISQNPKNQEYILVMGYSFEGDLRNI